MQHPEEPLIKLGKPHKRLYSVQFKFYIHITYKTGRTILLQIMALPIRSFQLLVQQCVVFPPLLSLLVSDSIDNGENQQYWLSEGVSLKNPIVIGDVFNFSSHIHYFLANRINVVVLIFPSDI